MSVLRAVSAALVWVVSTSALTSCGPEESSATGTGVVTSVYPLQYLSERIGGDRVEVTTLASNTGAHDIELTLSQAASLSDAELVIYLAGFEPAVDEAVEQNGPERVLDVGDVVGLRTLGEDSDHDDEHADGDGGLDPHFWLDPERMGAAAEAVAAALTDAAPDHAEDFEANLGRLQADLDDLDAAFREGLRTCRISTVVVSHDAFGYLERFGLEFASIAGLSPEAEPSLRHVAELQDLIGDAGVTTVFAEPHGSSAMAETIATDLGLEVALLDPIEALSDETADEDYLSLMEQNLEALREANQCQ